MYQALYRKWRPRTFDDVVGQEHVTRTLKKQVCEGSLSHAYLFVGTRGTGKTSCAKILSKAVNCQHPVNGNPCNCCPACLGIDNGSITDVVEMDAASNNGVDDVRALRDEAVFTPAQVKKRVYIVDEVHMLSTSAFNALLKIIEEPPEHLMFILATTDVQKVPATILSRCQRYSFKRLDVPSIVGRLQYIASQENIALTEGGANLIARISEGGMRDAVSLLDQCSGYGEVNEETVDSVLGLAGHTGVLKLCRAISSHDVAGALTLFSDLWTDGKDPASLLSELSALYREVLVHMEAPGADNLLTGSYRTEELQSLASAMTADEVICHLETIRSCLASVRAGSARLGCEVCIVSLCREEGGGSLSSLRTRVEALENQLRSGHLPERPAPLPENRLSPAPAPSRAAAPVPAAPVKAPEPAASKTEEPVESAGSAAPAAEGNELAVLKNALISKLPKGMAAIIGSAQVEMAYDDGTLFIRLLNRFASVMIGQADSKAMMEKIAQTALGKKVVVRVTDQEAPLPQKKAPEPVPAVPVPRQEPPVNPEPVQAPEVPAERAESPRTEPEPKPEPEAKEDKLAYLHQFDIVRFTDK